jgi:hypothetical protein
LIARLTRCREIWTDWGVGDKNAMKINPGKIKQ